MRYHIMGRIWGAGQLLFWIILIPWIILTIPLCLFYENHITPDWLQKIYDLPWVGWEWGILWISTFNMLLVSITLVWIGWHKMHPLVPNHAVAVAEPESLSLDSNNQSPDRKSYEISTKKSPANRLALVKQFSKEGYIQQIRAEAHQVALSRKKKRIAKNQRENLS